MDLEYGIGLCCKYANIGIDNISPIMWFVIDNRIVAQEQKTRYLVQTITAYILST